MAPFNGTTTVRESIKLCAKSTRNMSSPHGDTILMVLNALSITVNILHIVILTSMQRIKEYPHVKIFINIAFADILTSASFLVRVSVRDFSIFFQHDPIWVYIYDVTLNFVPLVRCLLLTLATIERYIAVCRPITYHTSIVISRLTMWLTLLWIFGLFLTICRDSFCDICVSEMMGPVVYYDVKFIYFVLGVNLTTNCSSIIFLALVFRELRHMRSRTRTSSNNLIINATKYVGCIFLFFFLGILSPALHVIFSFFLGMTYRGSNYVDMCLTSSYGIMNAVIYGWIIPAYRGHTKNYCCGTENKEEEIIIEIPELTKRTWV